MLSRIVSVRYSLLTTVSRGRPCATTSRPSHLSSRALMIAWLGVRAQAGAQAAPVRADDAQPAYLAASGKMMLAATQPAGLSFNTRCFPRFLCLGRQRPSLAAQCYFPRSSLAFCASGGRGLHWRLSAYAVDRPRGHDARHLSTA